MVVIKKKIWPEYFELVKSGKKRFELRVADFEIYVFKFSLDKFGQKDLIEKHGLYVIQLESD